MKTRDMEKQTNAILRLTQMGAISQHCYGLSLSPFCRQVQTGALVDAVGCPLKAIVRIETTSLVF